MPGCGCSTRPWPRSRWSPAPARSPPGRPTCCARPGTAAPSPTSPRCCTCRRARSATTCRPPSGRPAPAPAPRRSSSPRTTAGSSAPPDGFRAESDVGFGAESAGEAARTLGCVTTTLEPATAVAPLRLGALTVDPAVVLAPMAGITNPAFRTLCREFGAGLYVCEMITTRALVERNEKTLQMVRATPDEKDAFSVQLYGVDPATVGRAVEMLVDEEVAGTRPAHVDLNFGCPVPKVTRKGGGAALPWRRRLFSDIV